jgi:hypothetical protein
MKISTSFRVGALLGTLSQLVLTAGASGTFSTGTLSGDSDIGLTADGTFTHAINLGDSANLTVNGVVFSGGGLGGTNNYNVTGTNATFTGWSAPQISGAANGLFTNFNFVSGGGNESVTLNNLRVGQQYTTTFYNALWGGPRGQNITTSDGGAISFDQDAVSGSVLKYTFTAQSNSLTYNFVPTSANASFHQYAFSNQVNGYKALLTDNFYAAGTSNTYDTNFNLAARQGGSIGAISPISWNSINNTQVGNSTGGIDGGNYLLTAGFTGSSALNYNFNGAASQGGLSVSFDMAPSINNTGDMTHWGAFNFGAAEADKNVFVNGSATHFGILFRANGLLQAFDGSTNITPSEPSWGSADATNALHRFEIQLTDPTDQNPFDGVGQTNIDVYADGILRYSHVKGGGGYANNFMNWEAANISGIDNLVIAQIPEPSSVLLLLAGGLFLKRRRS